MSGIAGMPEFARDARVEPQPRDNDRVVRAVVLGVLAALGGAAVWVAVGAATKHEIGFVAVGVGYLVSMSMSRARADWRRLPLLAAAIALVAVVAGDFVLDVALQAQYQQVGFGDVLGAVATDLSLAKDLFSAYWSPVDLLFWLLAALVAYRGVKASVAAQRAPADPYGPTA